MGWDLGWAPPPGAGAASRGLIGLLRIRLLQAVDRRAALGLLAATAAVVGGAQPASAEYGDAARVFAGKITNKSGACRS